MRSFENILIDLEDADIDLILSNRDLYVFSNSWARAYKEIKKKPVNNQEQKQICYVDVCCKMYIIFFLLLCSIINIMLSTFIR